MLLSHLGEYEEEGYGKPVLLYILLFQLISSVSECVKFSSDCNCHQLAPFHDEDMQFASFIVDFPKYISLA